MTPFNINYDANSLQNIQKYSIYYNETKNTFTTFTTEEYLKDLQSKMIETQEKRLEKHEEEIFGLHRDIGEIKGKLYSVENIMTSIDKRLSLIENKLTSMDNKLNDVEKNLTEVKTNQKWIIRIGGFLFVVIIPLLVKYGFEIFEKLMSK